jgi:hypothetical protein
VVIDAEFADEAERSGWLSEFAISEHFEARLKGLPEPVRVARIVADRVTTDASSQGLALA